MAEPRTEIGKKYIILDSCVIQAAGSSQRTKSEAVLNHLKNLSEEGFSLAISEITVYENLHGLWGKRAIAAAELLKRYEWKVISDLVLLLASMLGGLYHDEKQEGIDTGDKIIAATAILETGYVLTENHRDFPPPFFINERSIPISYKIGQIVKTLDLALYKPYGELIVRRINEKQ